MSNVTLIFQKYGHFIRYFEKIVTFVTYFKNKWFLAIFSCGMKQKGDKEILVGYGMKMRLH